MTKLQNDMVERLIALAMMCDLELAMDAREVFPAKQNDFDPAWEAFEKHGNRMPAEKAWRKLSPEERAACMKVIDAYVAVTNTNGEFPSRKHFSTYLNQRAWEDELPAGKKGPVIAPVSSDFSEQ